MKRLLALVLLLCVGLAHGQNILANTDPTTWTKTTVTVTGGETDPFGGTGAYLVTTTSSGGNNYTIQSGLTVGKWYRVSAWLKACSETSLVALYSGDGLGRTQTENNITGPITTTWQRMQSKIGWATSATTAYIGIQITGSSECVYVYDWRLEVANTFTPSIIVIGDSFTTRPTKIPTYLETGVYGNTVLAKGVSGQTSTQILARFDNDAASFKPKTIVVHAGINDLAAGTSASTILTNLNSMVTKATSTGAKIILVVPGPWDGSASWTSGKQAQHDSLRTSMLALDNGNTIRIYDAFTDACSDGLSPPSLTATCDSGDHLHRSSKGYGVMSRGIKELM